MDDVREVPFVELQGGRVQGVVSSGSDPQRVYVAGLSAGGAAAAIMGDAYSDLFAAIGVHSGLACGAARDMPSAFAAMHGGSAAGAATVRPGAKPHIVPAIVFHGDRDSTVNPRNADAIVAQSAQAVALSKHVEQGRVPGGHDYSRTLSTDAAGRTVIEQWVVHGAGHAWSGGSTAGSYCDPRGPDATDTIVRFFAEATEDRRRLTERTSAPPNGDGAANEAADPRRPG